MRLIDKLLNKIGLMRKSKHEAAQDSWKHYTEQLGKAAKEKGVNVVFDGSSLEGIKFYSDVFVLGSHNYIYNCDFISAKILFAPKTVNNYLNNGWFRESEPPEGSEPAIFGNTFIGETLIGYKV